MLKIIFVTLTICLLTIECSKNDVSKDDVSKFNLTIDSTAGGNLNISSGAYDENTTVTLIASPDEGYKFIGWSDGSTNSSLTITINSNITVTATFVLLDETQPTITLVGSPTINLLTGATFIDPGATASDDVDGDLSNSIIKSGVPDTTIAGTYTITYSVSDAAGNTNSGVRIIIVSDDSPSYTTNLTPFTNTDPGYGNFTKKVIVFDIPLYGTNEVDDVKLFHAANVFAQYLDNDEDGIPDNILVVEAIKENNGFLLMWKNESDLMIFDSLENPDAGQDLGADETIPNWHTNGNTGQFDASLEEILHLITHVGYHNAYPAIFGESTGSSIANAMDVARGGQFINIPETYSENAWYTYDDETCDYACQVTEYTYWALTSILGAQSNRLGDIGHEWSLNTSAKVQQTDAAVYDLLTESQYGFPTVLPDGKYQQ